jgi:NADPH-dependent curcumin reductase CurA
MTPTTRRIVMARRPSGMPVADDFGLVDVLLPEPGAGEVRVQLSHISLDPYIRLRMAGRHLVGNLTPGDPITSEMVGVVTASRAAELPEGTTVAGFSAWQTHSVLPAAELRAIDFGPLSRSLALGVLGMPGLTAYAGITRLMKPGPGDVVVVSAASGPVGATVGQLARLAGARVIGIAGGPEKCAWATGPARFDACIDHRAGDVSAQLQALCPEGPTAYFDNVGGELLRRMIRALRPYGRVVLCGIIADYNDTAEAAGPTPLEIISARATVMGLVVYDHEDLRPEWVAKGRALIQAGDLAVREDITHGFEAAPAAFIRLMQGGNQGKALVAL